jgi:hypothetical protein
MEISEAMLVLGMERWQFALMITACSLPLVIAMAVVAAMDDKKHRRPHGERRRH